MSENQTTKGLNKLKRTNHIISEQIAKIQKDTQELINRTIDGQPSKVSVVKISENKIIIEVDLNETNLSLKNIENLVCPPDNTNGKNKPLKENQSSNSGTSLTAKSTNKLDKNDSSIDPKTINSDQSNIENVDLDGLCNDKPPLKGILKYSNSWKKRTLSESSFDNSSSSFISDHEDDDNNFSLSCTDLDCYTPDKSLKKVTFNKQISSKLFSKNQRTLESRKKGKKHNKKNNNKKAKGNNDKKQQIQQLSNQQTVETESLINEKSNISIDELSFLVCTSEESDTSNLVPSKNNFKNSDLCTIESNNLENSICDDEDDLLLDQKIDHQELDKENWSEMKSSKKVKKNRKRNDSGSFDSSNSDLTINSTKLTTTDINDSAVTNSGNQEESCDQESSACKQMSLGIKNLIQVN